MSANDELLLDVQYISMTSRPNGFFLKLFMFSLSLYDLKSGSSSFKMNVVSFQKSGNTQTNEIIPVTLHSAYVVILAIPIAKFLLEHWYTQ